MEGVSFVREIFSLIADIGTIPSLLILGVVIWFVVKGLKQQVSGMGKSLDSLRAKSERDFQQLDSALEELRNYSDTKDAELARSMEEICDDLREKVEDLSAQINAIKQDYMTREQCMKDVEGWKMEVQLIRQEMSKLPLEIVRTFSLVSKKEGKGEA